MSQQSNTNVEQTKHLGARVPLEMWQALKEAANKRDLTITQLIRRLVRDFLAEQNGAEKQNEH
jgi:predicted DNA-binding ribbon-helix-helix protein